MSDFIKYIFHLCVVLLQKLAEFFGTDYYTINVILFCVLVPVLFILLIIYIFHLRRKIKKLKLQL